MAPSRRGADPRCVIVTGMPGAGKSTVTKLLAGELPRAARISGDVVADMVLGGRVWALGEPVDEAAAQVALTHRNVAALAQNTTAAGFTAVIDIVLETPAELAILTDSLKCDWLLVVLAPTIDVCRSRNAGRDEAERWTFANYGGLAAQMRRSFEGSGYWIDTSDLKPQDVVEEIRCQMNQNLQPTGGESTRPSR
ncbi:AAA family ATPase [Microbacterium sp. NPDC087589]|uniref:AAA family ATPase n=1 Tax=Microbacterium sp. NPDC087589 TaxID=3364191 RepID=UPI003809B4AD